MRVKEELLTVRKRLLKTVSMERKKKTDRLLGKWTTSQWPPFHQMTSVIPIHHMFDGSIHYGSYMPIMTVARKRSTNQRA